MDRGVNLLAAKTGIAARCLIAFVFEPAIWTVKDNNTYKHTYADEDALG